VRHQRRVVGVAGARYLRRGGGSECWRIKQGCLVILLAAGPHRPGSESGAVRESGTARHNPERVRVPAVRRAAAAGAGHGHRGQDARDVPDVAGHAGGQDCPPQGPGRRQPACGRHCGGNKRRAYHRLCWARGGHRQQRRQGHHCVGMAWHQGIRCQAARGRHARDLAQQPGGGGRRGGQRRVVPDSPQLRDSGQGRVCGQQRARDELGQSLARL
ncbi:hypothetical protein EC988_010063, partial [Linderina pennispora]